MAKNDPLIDQLAENLANNLRYLRERRGLTQSQLSKLCGVPRSTLANLETGAGNPTLAVLSRLASALQISLEELLSAPRGMGKLYKAGELPIEGKGTGGRVMISKLLPDPIPGNEILRMAMPPYTQFKGAPHRPGTREYLYCERGAVVLFAAGERFELEAGDVCAFHGDQPHSYSNETGKPTVTLGVVVLAPL